MIVDKVGMQVDKNAFNAMDYAKLVQVHHQTNVLVANLEDIYIMENVFHHAQQVCMEILILEHAYNATVIVNYVLVLITMLVKDADQVIS